MNILRDYFSDKSVLLGWSGGASFLSAASLETKIGMLLSGVMLISSIAMQYYKIIAVRNQDRRLEELHEIALKNARKGENEDDGEL